MTISTRCGSGVRIDALLGLSRCLEIVVVRNIWNPNYKHAHLSASAVNNAGWDVNQTALRHLLFNPVEYHLATSLEDVIEFR